MKHFFLFFVFSLVLISGSVFSRTAPAPSFSADDYRVGPRDQLLIRVWGEEELQTTEEVSSQGTISFFFLGDVKVSGLTANEIRNKVARQLVSQGYFNNPLVIVQIKEYRSKEVQIHGAVRNPGIYYLDSNYTTLLRLISLAGGPAEKRGTTAYVWRDGINHVLQNQDPEAMSAKEPEVEEPGDDSEFQIPEVLAGVDRIEVDLHRLMDQGDISGDVVIHPGDFVLILTIASQEVQKNFIWVEGQVKSPSQIEYRRGMTALQAVIQAGGVTDTSSPNRTIITRIEEDGSITTVRIRLKDISRGRKSDVPLQPGDRIMVPESFW